MVLLKLNYVPETIKMGLEKMIAGGQSGQTGPDAVNFVDLEHKKGRECAIQKVNVRVRQHKLKCVMRNRAPKIVKGTGVGGLTAVKIADPESERENIV